MGVLVCSANSILPKGAELLYLVRGGSHAYGLSTPESDEDIRGVFYPGVNDLLGIHHKTHIEKKEPDIVLKSLSEFIRLALDGNPNVLEQLFLDGPNVLYVHRDFRSFLILRKKVLSQRCRRNYMGYAIGQIHRLESGHTRDLGAKRKAVVEKFGYDTKNAMHCFRLILQCKYMLETGDLRVQVSDEEKTWLMSIREGKAFATLSEVREKAESMIAEVDAIKSDLPQFPDNKTLEDELVYVQKRLISEGH